MLFLDTAEYKVTRIRELEHENARLKEDKEILKKVLQLYSKEGV